MCPKKDQDHGWNTAPGLRSGAERLCPAEGRISFGHESAIMGNRTLWIVLGFIVIVLMLIAGLLPLPGQKDNVTPHSQPSPSQSTQ
jgi:hypothetical protein